MCRREYCIWHHHTGEAIKRPIQSSVPLVPALVRPEVEPVQLEWLMVRKHKLKSEQMQRKIARMNGEKGKTSRDRSLKVFKFLSLEKSTW